MFDNLIYNILEKQKERTEILHRVDSAIFSTKNTGIKIRCSGSSIEKRFSPELKQLPRSPPTQMHMHIHLISLVVGPSFCVVWRSRGAFQWLFKYPPLQYLPL